MSVKNWILQADLDLYFCTNENFLKSYVHSVLTGLNMVWEIT